MLDGKWMPIVFPITAQTLHDAKVPARDIMFEILPPHDSKSRHTDRDNYVLTSHLAIDVTYSGENKCRLTVGDTEEQWINGEILLFDSSIYHTAVNDADRDACRLADGSVAPRTIRGGMASGAIRL
jgi:aspartyl/asparaginyl beta-hydroxylase (cupin superfamily)